MSTWSDAPLVFVDAVRCPYCHTTRKPIIIRSARGGDGSSSRKHVCRVCGRRWILVIEPPEDTLPHFGSGRFPSDRIRAS